MKTLQLANKVAEKRLNPQWNFLAAKRLDGWGEEMIFNIPVPPGREDRERNESRRNQTETNTYMSVPCC